MQETLNTERKGNWIQTYSGISFYPIDPRQEDIEIVDIAHSLSLQCRYAGHCKEFYSVAEHCCHLHDIIEDKDKFAALMHDASEAYLVDIPRPVKPYLLNYYELEDKIQSVIFEKYQISFPYSKQVKELDYSILLDEKNILMNPSRQPWDMVGIKEIGAVIQCWQPKQAKQEFINRFMLHWNVIEKTRQEHA